MATGYGKAPVDKSPVARTITAARPKATISSTESAHFNSWGLKFQCRSRRGRATIAKAKSIISVGSCYWLIMLKGTLLGIVDGRLLFGQPCTYGGRCKCKGNEWSLRILAIIYISPSSSTHHVSIHMADPLPVSGYSVIHILHI